MPLNSNSPVILHLLQNVLLIALSIIFAPLCTTIAVSSVFISRLFPKHIRDEKSQQQWSHLSNKNAPVVVLVTGVGMSKGLAIARSFHRNGNIVIGADFEPNGIPVSGRFSKSISRFYRLPSSWGPDGPSLYIEALIRIIKKEGVDLWVSCSGVASAVEDGEAAEAVEKLTGCKVFQFGVDLTTTLHEKYSFTENTKNLGLNVPATHLVTSIVDAMKHLHPQQLSHQKPSKTRYIMKSVGVDDSIRADMTLLPKESIQKTQLHLSSLKPSPDRPFVLQQYINGPEYCTHSIVLRGKVVAFTACESAELLMHYKALPPNSDLFKAMLEYTRTYTEKTGTTLTGHFSLDFLVDGSDRSSSLMDRMYPIECNPRVHTAVVLFENESEKMARAYLEILNEKPAVSTTEVLIPTATVGYYWIGHDLVTRLILPVYFWIIRDISMQSMFGKWRIFIEHVVYWKDGTFEVWDPWPAWWLYCVHWPGVFAMSIYKRSWWSRCNVSTGKVFRC